MTEHDKLREAINSLCSACQKTLVIGPAADRMTRTVWEDDLIRVLAAAEQSLTFRRLPLPGELDDEALSLLYAGCFGTQPRSKNESMRAGYRALYEHLTKPKTKIVNVIEGSGRSSPPCTGSYETDNENVMHNYIDRLRADGFGLIKITTKEVPL